MKDKYTAPDIKIEALEQEDVLCFSDNDNVKGYSLFQSIAEDIFGA